MTPSTSPRLLTALGSYGLAVRRARGTGLREAITFVAPSAFLLVALAVFAGTGVIS